jgi:hypothetical protein
MRGIRIVFGVLALSFTLTAAYPSTAQQSREKLNGLVQQLQSDPGNQDLRKQIIQLANAIVPRPTVPDQFYFLVGEASSDFQVARGQRDYARSIDEFQKASLQAPWVGSVYLDLGKAQELAGLHADAVTSLQFYLLATPNARDRDEVKTWILEDQGAAAADARRASEAPETSEQMPSISRDWGTQQAGEESFIGSLNGAKYVHEEVCGGTKSVMIEGDRARIETHLFDCRRDGTAIRQLESKTWSNPIIGRRTELTNWPPSTCAHLFGTADCGTAFTINNRFAELDFYAGGEKVTPSQIEQIKQTAQWDVSPEIYNRVQ